MIQKKALHGILKYQSFGCEISLSDIYHASQTVDINWIVGVMETVNK